MDASTAHRAVLVTSPDGKIQFASGLAGLWIEEHFAAVSPQDRLPEALTRWLCNGASGTQSNFLLEQSECRLRFHVLSQEPESICFLLEKTAPHIPKNGQRRRLTEREREVLSWVAQGKTNAEIGQILGLRPRTIGKYLERIFPKLGVENRTAAARFCPTNGINLLLPNS